MAYVEPWYVWNSRDGWKKYQKLIVGGGGAGYNSREMGDWEKLKILIVEGESSF